MVDLPINSMLIFHSYVNVYQAGYVHIQIPNFLEDFSAIARSLLKAAESDLNAQNVWYFHHLASSKLRLLWKITIYSWVNPLFRLGHFQ